MALYRATESEALKETRSMIADHLLGMRRDRAQIKRLQAQYANDESAYGSMMRSRLQGETYRLRDHEDTLHVLADTTNTTRCRVSRRF